MDVLRHILNPALSEFDMQLSIRIGKQSTTPWLLFRELDHNLNYSPSSFQKLRTNCSFMHITMESVYIEKVMLRDRIFKEKSGYNATL